MAMDDGELLALLAGVRTTPIRVCRMNSYHAGKIGAHTNIILLSRKTVEKLESKHKDRDLKLYRLAEAIITQGDLFRASERSLVALWRSPQDASGKTHLYKAVVKATKQGHELYLQSVYPTDETGARNTRRRNKPL